MTKHSFKLGVILKSKMAHAHGKNWEKMLRHFLGIFALMTIMLALLNIATLTSVLITSLVFFYVGLFFGS